MGRIGNIINRKNKQDAKKAKIFTKLARKITVAVKEGGSDPNYNSALVSAIDDAKMANMPNDNIDRAIKKGTGEDSSNVFTEVVYEGYGPGGVAVLVECLSDNLNRTAGDVRSYFTKTNGNLGTSGCVSYMFDHLGAFIIDKNNVNLSEDELMLESLEEGASDFVSEGDHYEIYCESQDFAVLRDYFKKKDYPLEIAELTYVPQNFIKVEDTTDKNNVYKLIDLLEDNDDVQKVYTNIEED